jgi:hypothetical protein
VIWTPLAVIAIRYIIRHVPPRPEPHVHRRGRPEDRRPVYGARGCTGQALAGEAARW